MVTESSPPDVARPFQEFFRAETVAGLVLLAGTAVALLWANSPWAGTYVALLSVKGTVALGTVGLSKPLLLWINDGLMAIFFFVIGLEIKREILVGELSSLREAALPVAGAVGGMLVPALTFAVANAGRETSTGWGIPMATDIAFALGVLALLGRRLPPGLRIFLAALAIVDDLGAVLVIALFYSSGVSLAALAVAAGFFLLLLGANAAGARSPVVFTLLGTGLWAAMLSSGVHATVAGVLVAMTVPARGRLQPAEFAVQLQRLLGVFSRAGEAEQGVLANEERLAAVQAMQVACERVETPLQRFEHALSPWVSYGIMPLFALANAGVSLSRDAAGFLLGPLGLGVALGLLVGKPLGIAGFSLLAVRLRLASLPAGVTPALLVGVAFLGGIGFTMSLFITSMAFSEAAYLATAKLAVLVASTAAGATGVGMLLGASRRR
jgi:NhaA family Na+:H+ antiporter